MAALRLLITGASGRLGRKATAEALARGHDVRALSRTGIAPDGVTAIRANLTTDPLISATEGVDAVIHLAASMSGSEADIAQNTGLGTTRLIESCEATGVPHFILASSVAVYGLSPLDEGYVVNEDTLLEPNPDGRDAYTRSKLAQESALNTASIPTKTSLRIGAVWGPGQVWNSHLGLAKGPLLIRMGAEGQIPMAHIDRVTEALISAAELKPVSRAINIVDDDLPDRMGFLNAFQKSGWPKIVLPINWRLIDHFTSPSGRRFGLLNSPTLHARMKPVAWSCKRAMGELNLSPQPPFLSLMAKALGGGDVQ